MIGPHAKEDDLWARGESVIRAALVAAEAEMRAKLPEVTIRVTSSRDDRSPLHVVAEVWEGSGYRFVFSVLYTRFPGPHQSKGALVRHCKLQNGADSGFLRELDDSPAPESLGLDPSEEEISDSFEDTLMVVQQFKAIVVDSLTDGDYRE